MPKIKCEDIDIFYVVYRDGKEISGIDLSQTTLIVLHGGPGVVDHRIETNFWSRLSDNYQVVFPDQRACGDTSDGDPKKWGLSQCGKDIYNFSKALGIKKPIIAGVSWGGYVAMSYMVQYPKHPAAIILCSTEAKVDPDERRRMFNLISEASIGQIAYDHDFNPTLENTKAYFEKCAP